MSGPVLIMAGGTGGHVFPALAVANELRRRDVPVSWLGTRLGLEARVVPAANIDIDWIDVRGVRGKGLWSRVTATLGVLRAIVQARRVIARRRPAVVLGMG
ncbi:MAG: glycosyltransferase, partial [Pseudomonadota bacterium]